MKVLAIVIGIALVIALTIVGIWLLKRCTHAETVAKLTSVAIDVQHRDGQSDAVDHVAEGQQRKVRQGDGVTVDDVGYAKLDMGGCMLRIHRGSSLSVETIPTESAPLCVAGLGGGTVVSDAEKRIVVDAGWATVTSLGTEFLVHLNADQDLLLVVVREGAVEVATNEGSVVVKAGYMTWVERGSPPEPAQPARRSDVPDRFPTIEDLTRGRENDEDWLEVDDGGEPPDEGEPPVVTEPEPLRVALLAPLTGNLAALGEATRGGAEVAARDWNARGGVLGREVEMVVIDTMCDAKQADDLAERVIAGEGVNYIVGAVCSSVSIGVSEMANQAGVLQISPVSTHPEVTVNQDGSNKPYVFRGCFLDPFQGEADASFAVRELGARRAAVLVAEGSGHAEVVAESFAATFEQLGGKVVLFEAYGREAVDVRPLLAAVVEAEAEVVFLPDYGPHVNAIVQQAREIGVEAYAITPASWETVDLDPSGLADVFYSSHFSRYDERDVVQRFLASFEEAYGFPADSVAVLAYDATNVLLQAIEEAGIDDPKVVTDVLWAIDYEGVSGPMAFNDLGDAQKGVAISYVDDGSVQFVGFIEP